MVKHADQYRKWVRAAAVLLAMLMLLPAMCGSSRAETAPEDLIGAAFELLEEGNPFVSRFEQLTGREVETLFPSGVPYYFGGLSGPKGMGWFYLNYPDYNLHFSESNTDYFHYGTLYFYGLDCTGFTRYVLRACGKAPHPALSKMMDQWKLRQNHIYDNREGFGMPPYDQLKDTLQVGDLLIIKRETARYRHVMMYIGTLRDFGYTAEEEPSLEAYLDYPLVIHCGLSPFYGERFQKLIDENPEKYGKATTTDGGVAVSIVGVKAEDAPEHGHVQNTDYAWFRMNDGGYQLTVIDMSDVNKYCWYRP